MRTKITSVFLAALFGTSLLMLGAGCPGPAKPSVKTFKVATFKFVGYAPLDLAVEKGLFKGLNVELQRIEDTGARRAALSSGSVQGSVDIIDSFIINRSTGLPAQVIFKIDDSMGADGIVAKKDITSIKDLKGKTVAFPKDQPSHFFLLVLLDKNGMTMKDIVKKEMQEADQAGSAFVGGSVDAAVTWEPWLSKASKMPNAHVLTSSKETPGLIVDVFTVRDDYVKANPEAVKAFTEGWIAAIKYWRDHPKEANEIMAKSMKMDVKEFEENLAGIRYADLENNHAFFELKDGSSNFRKLVTQVNEVWMREGLIKKGVDPESIDGSKIIMSVK